MSGSCISEVMLATFLMQEPLKSFNIAQKKVEALPERTLTTRDPRISSPELGCQLVEMNLRPRQTKFYREPSLLVKETETFNANTPFFSICLFIYVPFAASKDS